MSRSSPRLGGRPKSTRSLLSKGSRKTASAQQAQGKWARIIDKVADTERGAGGTRRSRDGAESTPLRAVVAAAAAAASGARRRNAGGGMMPASKAIEREWRHTADVLLRQQRSYQSITHLVAHVRRAVAPRLAANRVIQRFAAFRAARLAVAVQRWRIGARRLRAAVAQVAPGARDRRFVLCLWMAREEQSAALRHHSVRRRALERAEATERASLCRRHAPCHSPLSPAPAPVPPPPPPAAGAADGCEHPATPLSLLASELLYLQRAERLSRRHLQQRRTAEVEAAFDTHRRACASEGAEGGEAGVVPPSSLLLRWAPRFVSRPAAFLDVAAALRDERESRTAVEAVEEVERVRFAQRQPQRRRLPPPPRSRCSSSSSCVPLKQQPPPSSAFSPHRPLFAADDEQPCVSEAGAVVAELPQQEGLLAEPELPDLLPPSEACAHRGPLRRTCPLLLALSPVPVLHSDSAARDSLVVRAYLRRFRRRGSDAAVEAKPAGNGAGSRHRSDEFFGLAPLGTASESAARGWRTLAMPLSPQAPPTCELPPGTGFVPVPPAAAAAAEETESRSGTLCEEAWRVRVGRARRGRRKVRGVPVS